MTGWVFGGRERERRGGVLIDGGGGGVVVELTNDGTDRICGCGASRESYNT